MWFISVLTPGGGVKTLATSDAQIASHGYASALRSRKQVQLMMGEWADFVKMVDGNLGGLFEGRDLLLWEYEGPEPPPEDWYKT